MYHLAVNAENAGLIICQPPGLYYTHITYSTKLAGNLAKACRVWARISRVLRAENASARVCGMFYKATVQSVLHFGGKTGVLSPATLQRLEGFHVKSARRMTGLLP